MSAWIGTHFVLPCLALCFVVASVRLWRGPSLPDRLVGLDVISFLVLNAFVAYGVIYEEPLYLDIALVMALISFIATLAFAKFIERGGTGASMD